MEHTWSCTKSKKTNVARYLLTKEVLKNELIVYYCVKGNADKQVPTKGDFWRTNKSVSGESQLKHWAESQNWKLVYDIRNQVRSSPILDLPPIHCPTPYLTSPRLYFPQPMKVSASFTTMMLVYRAHNWVLSTITSRNVND